MRTNLIHSLSIALLLSSTSTIALGDDQISVVQGDDAVTLTWPIATGEFGRIVIDSGGRLPLIRSLGIAATSTGDATPLLQGVDPVAFVTVGSRESPPDRPPDMSVFNVFFDNPAKRPFATYASRLDPKRYQVESSNGRATITVGDLTLGPLRGAFEITVFQGARLVQVEAVVSTKQDRVAFTYDAGLAAATETPGWKRIAWTDTEGSFHRENGASDLPDRPLMVRHRTLVAETDGGSVACFPPPHQFFYPRDYTDNQQTVWSGRNHRGLMKKSGFGIRQTETGGGNFVPWFNAPPGTKQRLGVFYLLTKGPAEDATREVLRYTHGDRFRDLPGHVTFTSHWHMALTMAAMKELADGNPRTVPDAVRMFKDMNVRVVHLAEFHGDGHPRDPGPLRLPEMAAMFAECKRLSDDQLLVLPGEEANADLGGGRPGVRTGHWLYFFPRPVFWTMKRAAGQPFVEEADPFGKVYHTGSRDDVVRLLKEEQGLAWTAHPRIKSSNWTPDSYRDEDFFRDPLWLGGAWKAMPADLSRDRLGERVLDLLDDMANWGAHKYVPGEVDVFKIDHTHELYGHMNVNYLRLERAPRYEDDWSPILDALRYGRFFVTTGEVLSSEFSVGRKASGEALRLDSEARPEVRIGLDWTFPMKFAEVISGDGEKVYRERIDLGDTGAFGQRQLFLRPDLKGRKWVRVEAWDVAGNGAISQPVWLESETK